MSVDKYDKYLIVDYCKKQKQKRKGINKNKKQNGKDINKNYTKHERLKYKQLRIKDGVENKIIEKQQQTESIRIYFDEKCPCCEFDFAEMNSDKKYNYIEMSEFICDMHPTCDYF